MIETHGLSKYYGDFIAVEDLSFSIKEGEVVAFLGPNGAGKSTTMKMLTGYLAPSAGNALVCGMEVAGNRDEVANRIGYLPENGPLYEEMTPLTLLNFFGDARSMDANYKSKRISEVTEQCALGTVLNKPIGKLSRGFRQRVGMANVLLHEPDVLIMDEPTAALAIKEVGKVLDLINGLKKIGVSVIIISHRMDDIFAVCDRVTALFQGTNFAEAELSKTSRDEVIGWIMGKK